ncbi:hypothetical protein SKAU_G00173800 [Synaphobranchus kaupii]|uniref:Uncharacterized protein n=1 Tax=Synaphobranchus kaupii TaxID=118154 RepID=A0A9Q1J0Z4_SYNKA|nr:hypothetical protein SKAU_G00173800 [Synaphobranchus kaupii]
MGLISMHRVPACPRCAGSSWPPFRAAYCLSRRSLQCLHTAHARLSQKAPPAHYPSKRPDIRRSERSPRSGGGPADCWWPFGRTETRGWQIGIRSETDERAVGERAVNGSLAAGGARLFVRIKGRL